MPLYEFVCPDHGQFEKIVTQATTDQPESCPKCGRSSPKILSVPGGFQWGKGGHWNKGA